jgi:hypothetical protein
MPKCVKEYKRFIHYLIKMPVVTPRPSESAELSEQITENNTDNTSSTSNATQVEKGDQDEVQPSRLKQLATNRFLWGFVAGSVSTFLGYSLYSFYSHNNKQVECIF